MLVVEADGSMLRGPLTGHPEAVGSGTLDCSKAHIGETSHRNISIPVYLPQIRISGKFISRLETSQGEHRAVLSLYLTRPIHLAYVRSKLCRTRAHGERRARQCGTMGSWALRALPSGNRI